MLLFAAKISDIGCGYIRYMPTGPKLTYFIVHIMKRQCLSQFVTSVSDTGCGYIR